MWRYSQPIGGYQIPQSGSGNTGEHQVAEKDDINIEDVIKHFKNMSPFGRKLISEVGKQYCVATIVQICHEKSFSKSELLIFQVLESSKTVLRKACASLRWKAKNL